MSLNMRAAYASAKALASPRGGEVAISQENDLITFVNSGVVSHWAREGALTSTTFSFTIASSLLCGSSIAAFVVRKFWLIFCFLDLNVTHHSNLIHRNGWKCVNRTWTRSIIKNYIAILTSPEVPSLFSAIHQFYSVKVNKRARWRTFNLSTLYYFILFYFVWPSVSFFRSKGFICILRPIQNWELQVHHQVRWCAPHPCWHSIQSPTS